MYNVLLQAFFWEVRSTIKVLESCGIICISTDIGICGDNRCVVETPAVQNFATEAYINKVHPSVFKLQTPQVMYTLYL